MGKFLQLEGFTKALRIVREACLPDMSVEQWAGRLTNGVHDPNPVGTSTFENALVGIRKFPPEKIPHFCNVAALVMRERGESEADIDAQAYAPIHWLNEQCGRVSARIGRSDEHIGLESTADVVSRFGKLLADIANAQSPRSEGGARVTEHEAALIRKDGWAVIRSVYAIMVLADSVGKQETM